MNEEVISETDIKTLEKRIRRIQAEKELFFVPGYEIIKNPLDPRLYAPNKKIKNVQDFRVVDMIKTMAALLFVEGGVGLAANQIGWNVKVFVMQNPNGPGYLNFINPRIIGATRYTDDAVVWSEEGCLSHPGIWGEVARIDEVILAAQTVRQPKEQKWIMRGLAARVVQHEIDHLNGLLFTDKKNQVRNIRHIEEGQLELRAAQDYDAEHGIPEPEVD
jgi:peptide deformylase